MNKALTEKWAKYGILKGIEEDYKDVVAQVLENQRVANESTSFDAAFKRLSIPLVRRIFGGISLLNKLISIQPLDKPAGLIRYINNNKETIKQATASTFKTKSVWDISFVQDVAFGAGVNAEAELAAIIAQDLAIEITRKVLVNIKNSAALRKVLVFTNPKSARIEILDFIEEIRKRHHRPKSNWLVTSPEVASSLFNSQNNKHESLGLIYWGIWEDINVYVDSLAPMSRMILGYKGEISFDSGYVYSPYVPLNLTAVILNPDTFAPRRNIMHQSSDLMVDNTYYASVEIANFNQD